MNAFCILVFPLAFCFDIGFYWILLDFVGFCWILLQIPSQQNPDGYHASRPMSISMNKQPHKHTTRHKHRPQRFNFPSTNIPDSRSPLRPKGVPRGWRLHSLLESSRTGSLFLKRPTIGSEIKHCHCLPLFWTFLITKGSFAVPEATNFLIQN